MYRIRQATNDAAACHAGHRKLHLHERSLGAAWRAGITNVMENVLVGHGDPAAVLEIVAKFRQIGENK
jgi:hypothetical protein